MSNINKRALREAAQQCFAQGPLNLVVYHGKMCLRNSDGIVFAVLRDTCFPEYSAENESYARLAELSSPATVLALLDELEVATDACNGWQRKFAEVDERLEAAEKRIAELTEFVQHVNKCLLKNGEYSPLSHELIHTVLGIRAGD